VLRMLKLGNKHWYMILSARTTAEQPPRKDPQMEYSKIVPQSKRKNM
nr:hypothetical protein [Tanacetum cinerariifolium]